MKINGKNAINQELQKLYGNNVMKIVENIKKISKKTLNHLMLNGFLLLKVMLYIKQTGHKRFSTN